MKRGIRGRLQALAEWLWAGSVVAGLTACGGGGGGAGTPPPPAEPSVPDAIAQAAAKAELRAYSTPSANKAELKWTDWIEGETGFRIDKSVNGSWTPVATLAANANQPRGMGWAGTLDAAATPYRVVALLTGGKEVALKSPAGLTELKLGPAPAGASIALSTAEPLKGEVKLSITGAPEAQSAGFYVDQRPDALPISGGKPNFETPWSTYPEADGGHKIRSLLQYAPDSFVEIERTVTVANPDLSVTIVPRISPWSPQAAVFVIPISRSGATTASASLSVDGRAVGTRTVLDCYFLNIANPCLPAYAFSLNTADYDFGSHALVARVVDAQGGETLATAPMIKAIPLAVTMTSPGPVRFSGPRLQVRGELTGDTAYPASLAINLDGRSLLQRDGYGPFNADFDLTGLPDAIYRLTTTAVGVNGRVGSTTDDSRLVLWQSTPPMSYEWVRDGVNWLAASGRDGVLMRASDSDGGGANLLAEWLRVGDPSITLADSIAGTEFRYANGQ